MSLPRRPGDVLPKERRRIARLHDRISYDRGKTWIDVSNYAVSYPCAADYRPTYEKGAIINLPGGRRWRRSTNYSRYSVEVGESAPATYEGPWYGTWWSMRDEGRDGELFTNFPPLRAWDQQDMVNEATTKALNDLADQTANVGENLATWRQTARLFGGKCSSLLDMLKAMKNRKEFQRFLNKSNRDFGRSTDVDKAARLYLQYVYGLRPLMQDVFNLYTKLKEESDEPLLYHGRGSAARSTHSDVERWIPASRGWIRRENRKNDSRCKCKLTARINPEWAFLRALNQLGLANPVSIAWDLVSWSFVVDWFMPIGSVLNAYSAPAGLIFVDGYHSTRISETHDIYYGVIDPDSVEGRSSAHKPARFPVTVEGYNRVRLDNFPRPGFWFDRDPLRGDRMFKALALGIVSLK